MSLSVHSPGWLVFNGGYIKSDRVHSPGTGRNQTCTRHLESAPTCSSDSIFFALTLAIVSSSLSPTVSSSLSYCSFWLAWKGFKTARRSQTHTLHLQSEPTCTHTHYTCFRQVSVFRENHSEGHETGPRLSYTETN